MLRAKSI